MNVVYKPDEWNYLKLELKKDIKKQEIISELKKEDKLQKLNSLKKKKYKTTYEPLNDIDNFNSRIKNNLNKNNKDFLKKKQINCIIL